MSLAVPLQRQRSDMQACQLEVPMSDHAMLARSQLIRASSAPDPLISAYSVCNSLDDMPEYEAGMDPLSSVSAQEEKRPQCAICMENRETLQLHCQHYFCSECLTQQLACRWPGPRVVFGYLNCGLCRALLEHEELEEPLREHKKLREKAVQVAVRKFCEDGLDTDLSQELGCAATPDQLRERAETQMVVFMCADCSNPFCAGRADCAALQEAKDEARHCGDCEWAALALANDRRCMVHGHRFAIYKCDSCCSAAVWACDGHHYCERCHDIPCQDKHFPCPGPELCPLGIPHPRNTEGNMYSDMESPSFVLGCSGCFGLATSADAQEDLGGPDGYDFGFPERNWWSFACGEELLLTIPEEEVQVRVRAQQPGLSHHGSAPSACELAERLLLLEQGVSSPEVLLLKLGGPSVGGKLVKMRLAVVGLDSCGQPLECAQRLLFLLHDVPLDSLRLWDARRALEPSGLAKKKRAQRRKHKVVFHDLPQKTGETDFDEIPSAVQWVDEKIHHNRNLSKCDIGMGALVAFWSIFIVGVLLLDV